jgi:hypothetical protein
MIRRQCRLPWLKRFAARLLAEPVSPQLIDLVQRLVEGTQPSDRYRKARNLVRQPAFHRR